MTDRLTALEAVIEDLRSSVRRLEVRVAELEGRATAGRAAELVTAAPSPLPATQGATPVARGWRDPIAVLSLLGRLFIVLGGGYLLRAMTDAGAIPPPVGVTLGLAYGLTWLVFADRAGGRQEVPSAVFHGIGAAMVAFPVVLEATTRFKVLPGTWGALALAALTAGLLAVAGRRRMQSLAWIAVVAAIPTSIIILAQTNIVVPHACFLIAFGVATLWMGYSLDWLLVRWPVAAVADIVAVGVTMRALSPQPQETPGAALAVQMALLGAYLASIAVRTLVRGRNVVPFEVVQACAALAIALGGAIAVTGATGAGAFALGAANMAFGVACYAVAFAFIDRQQQRGRNVYFYTTLALVLVLVGTHLLLPATALDLVFASLAVLACALWSRVGRLFFLLHGAAYLLAAGLVSGTLGYAIWAFASGQTGGWSPPALGAPVVAGAGLLSAWLASGEPKDGPQPHARWPRFLIVLVAVTSLGGVAVGLLAPVAAGAAVGAVDPGVLATLRTAVLALAVLAIAWVGRHDGYREWDWLVYPLLVATGVKMIAQDFMQSRPATLFVALALFGAALILAPRMRRRQA